MIAFVTAASAVHVTTIKEIQRRKKQITKQKLTEFD